MPTQQQSPVLLATDQSGSVLRRFGAGYAQLIAYNPFGFHNSNAATLLSGFNGHALERANLGYLLGNGYRNFSPCLLRFTSPDNMSPFGDGGINAYTYCSGDPQNFTDPSGHFSVLKSIKNVFGRTPTRKMLDNLQAGNYGVKINKEFNKYSISSQKATNKMVNAPTTAPSSQSAAILQTNGLYKTSGNLELIKNGAHSYNDKIALTRKQAKEMTARADIFNAERKRQNLVDLEKRINRENKLKSAYQQKQRTPKPNTEGYNFDDHNRNKAIRADRFK